MHTNQTHAEYDKNNNIIRSRSSWTDASKRKLAQDLAAKAQRERESVEKSLLQSRHELDQSLLFSRDMSELNTDGWWDWNLAQPEIYFFSDGLKYLLGYEAAEVPNSLSWNYDNTHPEDRKESKEVAQFGYRTSHDLKSPLVAISGLTECILLDLEDGEIEEAAANIGRIKQSSNSPTKWVYDNMELSRADLADEEEQNIDVPAMMKDKDCVLAESSGTHPAQPNCSNQITTPFASHPEQLWQVLYNLVSNSIRDANTVREHSFVDLQFSQSDQDIQIDIRDNGVGIPEKYHTRLFERFQRFHPKMAQSSGMDLSIVKCNIDRLGASIHFNSSPDGTHNCITIPVKDPAGTTQ